MRRPPASRFDESMTHSRPQELTETDVLVDAADQASRWKTGRLWRNGSQMRVRRIGTVATAIVILFSLCGCGSESSGADSQPPSKTPSPGRTDGPTAVPRGAERDPFHIGDAAWPVDLEGAAALYDDMPAKFKTRPVERMPMVKGAAGVAYGPGDVGPMAWSMEADKSVPDAQTALAVMFGMTMSCDKTTYQGTATPDRGGFGPAFGSGENTDPWWFACQVDGMEGSPKFRAFAVGWTSGDLGWLTVTPDQHTSHELLKVLAARTDG